LRLDSIKEVACINATPIKAIFWSPSMTLKYFLTVALAVSTLTATSLSQAETKPIKIVVGFAPGGSVDGLARLTGDALRQEMKSNVIVENKLGAEQLVLQRRETEMWGPIIKASGFTPED
jgi:hypothetical protein